MTKPISRKKQNKIEALSIEEQNKLISILNKDEFNHKYRNIILLQLYTGMRIGEVLALSYDCINLIENTLNIYRTLTQDKNYHTILGKHTKTYDKKTGIDKGARTFPMSSKVKNVIVEVLNNKITNINKLLFWDYKKDTFITPNEINSYLKRINDKYKISNTLHSHRLRHTFITRCAEKGMFLKVIQQLVRHIEGSDITSKIYTDVSLNFMEKELKKIN